ncbi:TetR/AcrR family transcriptional regulator [Paenibacillus hunanensis]|uniref:TetR/AcrR family transcriptional regulator n=1 Tax=Paenibacillus hunanensis TaxID=539262 RepID=UPI002A6A9369|nr:TetR/AcrR family transcriptional regulator [Paenibacillus hunanensis]WPP39351.1 TetR/AcrR family transcriptional regulator [Paenibacillus hunanensis]
MGRTKEFDHEEVLHAATLVFWQKGYEATSMAELLQAMNISRSSMYETFVDKEHLYLQSIEYYKRLGEDKRSELTRASSAREGIRAYFAKHIDGAFNPSSPRGCLITNAIAALDAPDEQIRDIVQKRFEDLGEAFYKLLQKGQDSGEIAADRDIRTLSYLLLNLNHGINIAAKVDSDRTHAEQMVESVIDML